MSRGKYLSLEEAINDKKMDRFCKEHPSTGDEKTLLDTITAMALNKPKKPWPIS